MTLVTTEMKWILSSRWQRLLLGMVATCLMLGVAAAEEPKKLNALIIDGQNNHQAWPKTTVMMKSYLENSGRFNVQVQRTKYTWNGGELLDAYPLGDGKTYEDLGKPKSDPDFKPNFADFDVVISNFGWNAAPWPEATQKALQQYVSSGGGFVVVHAADNSFGSWTEFNEMIGLGGWDGRNEQSGPYVYIDKSGEVQRDQTPGPGGNHGPAHEYQVVVRQPDHPIVKGLPRAWMHSKDELYQKLRGPALNMTILATAYADPQYRGTDRHEPKLMTIDYQQGRIFHTTMGHDEGAVSCVGFITTFVRGCEWAATGKVTLTDVPDDFPAQDKVSTRDFD
ncbi:ThuA domain-containing protein [Stieleria sp. JC731]|uniref:ThuA domain-containing protein n=1 Tax=Pirellulaceae TaxID=2691357 RepID=UPI001E46805D|nr:ThuA domain-containing protein [Stieleria sp. JC731]MCC9599274.1 ThuA domain-containing protein [Stieleria sp. JC731]